MAGTFQAVPVSEHVWWVGAIDWDVRDFHGYATERGTTYNAYLIVADEVTLVDTVKAPFYDEMMARIASVVDPRRIETIISNHAELDHSGCLMRTIEAVSPAKVYASVNGVRVLEAHFHNDAPIDAVAEGETLQLGGATITFAETRMCHWPDSMVSYLHEDQLLFSQDAFGMHLAGSERFADQVPPELLRFEAAKYYANILLHLSPFIRKTLDKLGRLNLPLKVVAPDHGPVWRKEIDTVIGWYDRWAEQQRCETALIVYDSMWGSTEKMARAIAQGVIDGGATAKVLSLRANHRSNIATEILDAGALIVGSPTLNNTIFPTLADCLTYLKGLRPLNLIGATFGSYGWSGEAAGQLHQMLAEMDVELVAEPLRVKYVPDEAAFEQCVALGRQVAERLTRPAEALPDARSSRA